MAEIYIEFQGVCTHLFPMHMDVHDEFRLFTGDETLSEVSHRVVLANPDMVATHIDPGRCVPPHVPKLIVVRGIQQKLADRMTCCGRRYEMALKGLAIGFDGVRTAENDPWKSLQKIPHMKEKDRRDHLRLRPLIKRGWSKFASAYIDFTTGVKFVSHMNSAKQNVVTATVQFEPFVQPNLVFRPENGDRTETYEIDDRAFLIVSNLPPAYCGNSDYLLNYFVTTLDISESAPKWPDPPPSPAGTDVYCSSSGFP